MAAGPEFTPALWNELWKREQKQKVQEREEVRDAVVKSEIPLPDDLVRRLIRLSDEHSRMVLREHPGFTLAERRASYLTSISVLEMSIDDLLNAISHFEREALRKDSKLFFPINTAMLETIELRIQKELFAAANAAASLVDHSRRVQKRASIPDYENQLRICFGDDGLHDFVIGIRVLLHHLHIVETDWNLQATKEDRNASFRIDKATLLYAVAQFPERFGGEKGKRLLSYVNAAAESIDLSVTFVDYCGRVLRFHGWLRSQLDSESLVALRDYDRCVQEKKNHGTRTWWNALLMNWLRNWEVPPDPHNHLPNYLTVKQLAEVYKLPRNSKAQVDLVISYIDVDNAIDGGLRKLAYELFERSPQVLSANPR